MADTENYNISENVSNKIYIPYATYTGEGDAAVEAEAPAEEAASSEAAA